MQFNESSEAAQKNELIQREDIYLQCAKVINQKLSVVETMKGSVLRRIHPGRLKSPDARVRAPSQANSR